MENNKEIQAKDKRKKFFLAIFMVIGIALFIVAIFVIGNKQNLFTSTLKINSDFETVSGLKEGGIVRITGIGIGTVERITILDINKVKVEMTIESSQSKFIKKDSKATVISEGLVGNKIIEITAGSPSSPSVSDGDYIGSIKPVEMEDILKNLKETGDNTTKMTKELTDMVSNVNNGQGTIGQLMTNNDLYDKMSFTMEGVSQSSVELNKAIRLISGNIQDISGDITALTPKIRNITGDLAEISRKMNSSESIVGTLLTDTAFANNLKEIIVNANRSTEHIEDATFSLSQNMEALKHNFLFKGYFEDIGYWDKTDFEKSINKKELQLKLKEQELNERERRLNEKEKNLEETGQFNK
ncbi:MAG: MCE family protein [Ignavibacteriae bacterium]|nr:MAG: MCE family protein [Ignavibacteriota bacterium]